jgi:hypothetical protein
MIQVRVLAGDDEGGPNAEAKIDFTYNDVEDVSDETLVKARDDMKHLFEAAFGEPPKFIIVTVDNLRSYSH